MRFSCAAVSILALASTSYAAPVKRDFLGAIKGAATEVGNLINSNATLSGIAGTAVQSIENPQLTAARLTVIKGLSDAQTALTQINSQANATGNTGVTSLVATGQTGVTNAHAALNSIGDALVSGTTPSKDDQKTVAVGIKAVRDAVNQMPAAITTPDSTLSSSITAAQGTMQSLQNGGEGVLSAQGLTFADLGLPDDFATS
ncbi:hypothetical protein JB92DRAFT_2899526 [Gautieria morchelliformis]|nr:hypothetical protein JB92DRAFT_2899526 [Gautieria morchelliformis]